MYFYDPIYGERNGGETNTFPWSDWPRDGSVQYRGNIHILNKNQDIRIQIQIQIQISDYFTCSVQLNSLLESKREGISAL